MLSSLLKYGVAHLLSNVEWSRFRGSICATRLHAVEEADKMFRKGVEFYDRGQTDLACDCYRQVLRLNPSHAEACNNLGIIYHRRGDIEHAKKAFQQALQIDSALPQSYINLGNLFQDQCDLQNALKQYDFALNLDQESAHARYARATALLAMGRFDLGWKEYEWRWKLPGAERRVTPFVQPRWDGRQDISGKSVLLFEEQGFGDTIQFVRYAPLVAARGARVTLACRRELRSLIQTMEGVDTVVAEGEALPEIDYQIPLLSLPLAFDTTLETIPAQIPYFFPDQGRIDQWRARLGSREGKLRVGLAWAGNPKFAGDKERTCSIDKLSDLVESPDCVFYSLQKGNAAETADRLEITGQKLADYTSELNNFHDTAALIQALDLVITVDTVVAHLAGALAKPVWVMLPFSADWRWMTDGETTPWYPTMRLFRQSSPGEWHEVVQNLKRTLSRF